MPRAVCVMLDQRCKRSTSTWFILSTINSTSWRCVVWRKKHRLRLLILFSLPYRCLCSRAKFVAWRVLPRSLSTYLRNTSHHIQAPELREADLHKVDWLCLSLDALLLYFFLFWPAHFLFLKLIMTINDIATIRHWKEEDWKDPLVTKNDLQF